jgi:aldose 1-epimerase
MLPTGIRRQLPDAEPYAAGRRYGDIKFDDVFSGLTFTGDWCNASLFDPASGVTATQRFDKSFRECVVYTPPHREAICIEPLTCVPSSFELTRQGIDAGLRILSPGESFNARVEIAVTQR